MFADLNDPALQPESIKVGLILEITISEGLRIKLDEMFSQEEKAYSKIWGATSVVCKDATTPKTRTEFLLEKFDKNVKNDQIKQEKIRELGWKVIVIWECELKRSFQKTLDKVEKELTRKPFIGAQN